MTAVSSGWLKYNNSDLVIVFVHGLFSDNKKCWKHNKTDCFWPQLILEDSRFKKPSIYLSNFYTAVDSNDYGVGECATEVFDQLKREDEEHRPPPLSKNKIVFVTHSTGGIVVRYLLEAYSDEFSDKKIGLALYASPSYGSKLATSVGWIARLFKNKLAQELSWGSSILEDLDGRFLNLLEREKLNITGFEAYENRSPFHVPYINNSKNRIVEKLSASRYFGRPKLVPKSDHSSIVKPDGKDHFSHKILLDFIINKNFIKNNLLEADVLFDQYREENEKFYVDREYDHEIFSTLENNSLWVCGPTGVGKTVAIQRYLKNKDFTPLYISLGACINESMAYIFSDILNSINPEQVEYNKPIPELIKVISEEITNLSQENDFCLFIEEIPIKNKKMFIEFSEYIYTLLLLTKNSKRFRLILSSIYEPANLDGSELEKISEIFRIIKSNHWSDKEISQLINIIEEEINTKESMKEKIADFEGSPRKVKIFYREKLVTS